MHAIFALACVTVGASAAAHSGSLIGGGVGAGFVHPFSGLDHLLAMVAVGLWGAFLGRPLIVLLPVIFPSVMALGGALGMAGVDLPPVEIGIAVSVLGLGAMIALAVRAPVWVAAPIVAVFAIFHGFAHGQELPSAAEPVAYSLGFVFATGLLHVAGIGLGLINAVPRGILVTRTIGAGIAAAGLWYLAQALA